MASLEEFKQQNPAYKDVPDMELAAALHKKYYSSIPKEEYFKKLGLNDSQEPKISRGEAAFKTGLQGGTLGFADEITAGLAAGFAKAFGGNVTKNVPFKELYKEARDSERSEVKQAYEEYPMQSALTEGAASIPTSFGALKSIGQTGNTLIDIAKQSAILSSVQGLGETKDITNPSQVISDVGESAAYGTAFGTALGGASKLVGATAKSAKKLIKGTDAENILESAIKPEDAARLSNKLQKAEVEGRNRILPDVAGDEMAGLTRLLAKTTGSKNIIDETISNRTAQSARKVANLINNKISSKAYFGNIDDIIKARAEVSKPLYEDAYKKGRIIPKAQVEEIVSDPRVTEAITKARKDFGIAPNVKYNSVEALHGARQVIDDVIDVAKRQGEDNKVRAYTELKKKMNNVLYKASPSLRDADRTWSGYSSLKSAQEEGLDFNKYTSPEELKKLITQYTPGEKDAFKIGVRENLMRSVDKSGDSSSVARKIFGNPLNRDKLKIVFDNPKEYSDFAKRMIDEIRVFDTKQRILGGSRTDINLKDEAEIINKVASGIASPKATVITAVTDSLKKRYIGLNENNAKQLAQIITSRSKSIDALNKIAEKASPEQKKIILQTYKDILPAVVGANVGKLLIDN